MTARWTTVLLLVAMTLPGWGQSPPQVGFAITTGQIVEALSQRGIQISERQISMAASVIANQAHPALDLLSVEHPPGNVASATGSEPRYWVKLSCHLPGACLPFYAVVNWPAHAAPTATTVTAVPTAIETVMSKSNAMITMRAGTHAILVMDDDRSQIKVSVISLENGIVGHRIRVESADHKQFYSAEVVSANLLKGSF